MDHYEIPFFFAGFAAGLLVGAAAALLLAPQSGEETQAQIRAKGGELQTQAHETYDHAREQIGATTEQIRVKASETAAKLEQALPHGQPKTAKEVPDVTQG